MPDNLPTAIKKGLLQQEGEGAAAIVSPSATFTVDIEVVRLLSSKKMGIILLCMDRSPSAYLQSLKDTDIDTASTYFLDMTGSGQKGDNILLVEDVGNLSYVSIALFKLLDKATKEFPGKRFAVVFDSLESMRLYTEADSFARFLHATNLRLRTLNIYQAYVLDNSSLTLPNVRKFCDVVLEFGTKPEEEFAKALGAGT